MAKSEIRATLTLDCSQFNSAISQAQSKVGSLSSSSVSKFTAVGTTMSNVGNNIQKRYLTWLRGTETRRILY